jgi:phage terminase large subunit-like protein
MLRRPTRSAIWTTATSFRGVVPPDASAHKPLRSFTVDHWRRYARLMVLDSGDYWDPEQFQLEFVADLMADTTEVWAIWPEGNGKTTLLSGVGLYWTDYTPSAAVLVGASARDQAGLMFSQAAGFVWRSPGFDKRFRVFEGYRRITSHRSRGRMQVFAADDRTGDGVLFDLALLDELHRHRDLRLYRTWRGKAHKRNGKIGGISTAGEPGTEFEDAREKLLGAASEITRTGFHTRAASGEAILHDYSVPASEDVEDMEVVKRANPLEAITVDDLRKKRESPTMTLNHWRRFVCNQAVRTEESAIDPREWADLGTSERPPEGEPVDVGLDLGWKHDTTAIVPLWAPERDRMLFGRPEILTPPRDGSILPPDAVKRAFREIHERNPIRRVVMDPDRGAEIAVWLEDDLGVEVVEYLQTNQPMAMAYERWMEAMRGRGLRHGRDDEFTEHVLNAVAKLLPDGRARFDRPSSSRAQAGQRRRVIDALIAGAMVLSVTVAEFDAPAPDNSFAFL